MSENNSSFSKFQCGDLEIDLEVPQLMGILNLTDDSFFDGGRYNKGDGFLSRAEKLVVEGCTIIDIGAASTRPGAELIDEQEEWRILEKPLQVLRKKYPSILLSVDTYNAGQVKKCNHLGVNIINDISGGTWDSQMYAEVAQYQMAYVMMHIKGEPKTMQNQTTYSSVIDEVKNYFEEGIKKLNELDFKNIILDPGFGFAKTLEQNYELLGKMSQLEAFGYPILAGLSRKSMIFRALGISPQEALNGTTALNILALLNGAKVLRVHDAKEARETIQLFSLYKRGEKES
ncbi:MULTISPECIES: dihydropteroate synthase [unclassified Lentimicrobium]|uniref:dihydropteroate synthase n=1 Tax=unclassified Lentimicrobium TaxID=2677434 RepID=UPI00155631BC|nr:MULTISPECIES: dihydropteroate synthase [unclassified Lentimicrobium]NPD44418.1 dihydropteroate synthase [Lentimicrobium sp. S6]NPD84316.1 dihydropteroate synthase [Lentimicrobium sp. L6]